MYCNYQHVIHEFPYVAKLFLARRKRKILAFHKVKIGHSSHMVRRVIRKSRHLHGLTNRIFMISQKHAPLRVAVKTAASRARALAPHEHSPQRISRSLHSKLRTLFPRRELLFTNGTTELINIYDTNATLGQNIHTKCCNICVSCHSTHE